MKKILAFFILIAISVSLIACGTSSEQNNNNNQTNNSKPNNEEQIKPSAYEQLNYNEKLVFDTLIINIDDMNNPSAIKVLEVAASSYLGEEVDNLDVANKVRLIYYIRLIVPNAAGGTVTKWYEVAYDDFTVNGGFYYKKGYIAEASLGYNSTLPEFYTEFHNANPSKINAALQEHWENLGLL